MSAPAIVMTTIETVTGVGAEVAAEVAAEIEIAKIGEKKRRKIEEIGKENGNRIKIARETVVIVRNLEKRVRNLMPQLILTLLKRTHFVPNLVWLL